MSSAAVFSVSIQQGSPFFPVRRYYKRFSYYYLWRFLKWTRGDRRPLGASIKITSRCNQTCSHCRWYNNLQKDLPASEWKAIITDLFEMGVMMLIVEGGEPTLRKDLGEILAHAKGLGIYVVLVSNGSKNLKFIEADRIWLSIDGMEKNHDRIRGKGSFKRAVENIGLSSRDDIIISTSISKTNAGDSEEMVSFFRDKVRGIQFSFTYPYKGISEKVLDKKARIETAVMIISLKEKNPEFVLNSYSFLKNVGKSLGCPGWALAEVDSRGEMVTGCIVDALEEHDCSRCDLGCKEMTQSWFMETDARSVWRENFAVPFPEIPFESRIKWLLRKIAKMEYPASIPHFRSYKLKLPLNPSERSGIVESMKKGLEPVKYKEGTEYK